MAGVKLEIDEQAVLDALGELMQRGRDLAPAYREIGEYLDLAHRWRFDQQVAPDGTPWAPLSDVTKAKKTRHVDEALVDSSDLRDLLRYNVSEDRLEFGTDRPYGAIHHYGAQQGASGRGSYKTRKGSFPIPWGDIPARPWAGISDDDREPILVILRGHLVDG